MTVQGALTFDGLALPAVETPGASLSGIETVYMINTADGVNISYAAQTDNVTWYQYYANNTEMTEVTGVVRNGNTYTIPASMQDVGYVIWDGTNQYYYWVSNYNNHRLTLDAITVSDESACDRTALRVDGVCDHINYFSISGRAFQLSREMTIEYRTLEYDSEQTVWREMNAIDTQPNLSALMTVDAPLCDTEFTLTGDRFLRAWGSPLSVQTGLYNTPAVRAETTAVQSRRDNPNEQNPAVDALGGSAPCVITFTARPTDAAVFREWQFSRTEEFEDIYQRFAQDELEYTFTEQGTFYVRFQCGDAAGVCFDESPIYTVSVGESKLDCPNAFSPFNRDGVNDEWKVSYQSLVSFECHIFNRWGVKIASFTDPAQGWDGKHNGKFVPAGVYLYVIKAVGADGVKYNKSGDINILKSRQYNSSASPEE